MSKLIGLLNQILQYACFLKGLQAYWSVKFDPPIENFPLQYRFWSRICISAGYQWGSTMTSNGQNQKTSRLKSFLQKAEHYLVGYLLYAGTMAALFFLLFRIRLDAILITSGMGYNIVQVRGTSNFIIVILALIMLVGVGYSEDRLRKAIEENRMWKVLLRIYLVTAAAWIFWLCIYTVAKWIVY